MEVVLRMAGRPHAQQRHRTDFVRRRHYDPKANVDFARALGLTARPHFPALITGPVSLDLTFFFAPAPSLSRVKRAALVGQPHLAKPDTDNLTKAVKDALSGVAWVDDQQVWSERIRKLWAGHSETIIIIRWGILHEV